MPAIKEPKEWNFDKIGHKGKVFPTTDLSSRGQVVLMESEKGLDVSLIQNECDYFYYVIKGSGTFVIEGKEEICEEGDLVVVPAGSKYTFKGKLRLLLFSTPPWSEDQEEVVK